MLTPRDSSFVTVTKGAERRCGWCRRPLTEPTGLGRPAAYCRRSCRQRAYESRKQAAALGLGEHELIVTRTSLERLLDQIYVLQASIEDVDRDLAETDDPGEVQRSLRWLLSAARPLVDTALLREGDTSQ